MDSRATRRTNRAIAMLFAGCTLAGLLWVAPSATPSIVLDLVSACTVLGPPILFGFWEIRLFRLGDLQLRWRFLLAVGVGWGTTSLLILGLGSAGLLQRSVFMAVLVGMTVVGLPSARAAFIRTENAPSDSDEVSAGSTRYSWLLLLLCPFLVLALLAASNAPGFIWKEEGLGYDVLEYHLQVPREYLEAGRISYLPHNVYANFPMNVEMLYLLAMLVHGNAHDLGTTANTIHCLLGAMAVFAAWVAGREFGRPAGIVGAIALGSAGWSEYLSGLAYVENGLLFYGMASVSAVTRALQKGRGSGQSHWLFLGGLFCGMACGCKYTALAFLLLPMLAGLPLARREGTRGCILGQVYFLFGCTVAVAPWLLKSTLMTGNPVFPLCNPVFHASPPGWGEAEQERWDEGHAVPQQESSLGGRAGALWTRVLADPFQRFNPALVLLALGGLVGRSRDRGDAFLLVLLVCQIAVWLFATHLYSRFAVPLLLPLAILARRGVGLAWGRRRTVVVTTFLAVGCLWSLFFAIGRHQRESIPGATASLFYEGRVPGYEYLGVLNKELPAESRVLLLGDARAFYAPARTRYSVVFNHDPFAELLEGQSNEAPVEWLRSRGVTHLLIHWAEVRRLSQTYGFSSAVTPERIARLRTFGLELVRDFPSPLDQVPYVTMYGIAAR